VVKKKSQAARRQWLKLTAKFNAKVTLATLRDG
jgi:hypothetical protein